MPTDDNKPDLAKFNASVRVHLERSRRAFANPRDEDDRKILALIDKQLAELGS
jgi:hypothetical protein